ncbi:MAG: two-component regulator propeller domain-containing protein, partial [Pseudomonadales bacterium]
MSSAILCFLLLNAPTTFAAAKLADQRNVIFDRYTTEDGLSHTAITAITQDKYGFMWIGTQEGLNRFDGYKFENFYHRDDVEGAISNNSINVIEEGADGNLWVGTDNGLNLLNIDTLAFIPVSIRNESKETFQVLSLHEDSSGTLWIGTSSGLFSRPAGIKPHQNSTIVAGVDRIEIRDIIEDRRNIIWVTTDIDGLLRYDKETNRLLKHSSSLAGARSIIQLPNGSVWVANTSGGIAYLDSKLSLLSSHNSLTGTDARLPENRVRKFLVDKQGEIWVGTAGGLHLFDKNTSNFTLYVHDDTNPDSLSDNNVTDMYQDSGGVIWIGTYHGLSRFNAETLSFPKFRSATHEGLRSDATTSFTQGMGDDVWIGTFGGLHLWDSAQRRFKHFTADEYGLSDNRVMSLLAIEDTLWIGTMRGGINILKDDEIFALLEHDSLDEASISSNSVSTIYRDKNGDIWAATYGGGVNRYIGKGRFERFPKPSLPEGKFGSLRTLDIAEDDNGNLWIATDGGGVTVLNPATGTTTNITHDANTENSISSDNITTILHHKGEMWIGTRDSGLNRFNPSTGKFTYYGRTTGLASDVVYGMLVAANGELWISGGRGLSILNPLSGSVRIYDSTHGLQSDDFNSGAYAKLSDGTFIFGGNNGFNAFYPEKIQSNEHIPPIRITQFSKFNNPVQLDSPIYKTERIELSHRDSVFGLEFAAMDFTAPRKNRFRYRLEGFDRDWTEAIDTHQVTYTNLDAGNYLFSLQGSNNDGVWNESGTSLEIIVHPPIWATWWAYAIYLAIGLVLIRQALEANQ